MDSDLDGVAKRIADEASLMSPQEGDAHIRQQTKDFPEGIRALLLTMSSHMAEQSRTAAAVLAASLASNDLMHHNLNEERAEAGTDKLVQKLKEHGFYAGLIGFLVCLVLVFVMAPLNPTQWWVIRVLMCMCGALVSTAFCGFLNVKARIGVLAMAAGGGFGIFVITYFFNPPSLPPVEAGADQSQESAAIK
ncbi:MAG: hypothetical protein ABII82_19060 [Verrucomicrobiota bacterium]